MISKRNNKAFLLLIPAITAFIVLLVLPLTKILIESFKQFESGRIGAAKDAALTSINYIELLDPAYLSYFIDTFKIGFAASIITLMVSYPIAYFVARKHSSSFRSLSIGFLIAMMFLSALVRVYSLELTFGTVGLFGTVARKVGFSTNSLLYIKMLVVAGLLHYLVPICTLTLISTIQNVNPRLYEAAQALGSPRWRAHFSITIPLSMRGIISAFLIAYTLSISAFVIPMILGKGRVLFVSNLIYSRFSEVANYPSGSAISIVLLIFSLLFIYSVILVTASRFESN